LFLQDKFSTITFRCNELGPKFAKESEESLSKLTKLDFLNLFGNRLQDDGAKIIFDALTEKSISKSIKAIDFGRNDIANAD